MSTMKCRCSLFKAKSRSDDTLLTVEFNLRKLNDVRTLQSPARTTQWIDKVPSLRDLVETWHAASPIRRLKPTVNKVLSHAGHFAVDTTLVIVI